MAKYSFTVDDIKESIRHLKKGRSAASDQLQAEHQQYASPRLFVLPSLIFNAEVIHHFITLSLMDTVLIPILKDKNGDVTDENSYQPIAMTTVVSKVF